MLTLIMCCSRMHLHRYAGAQALQGLINPTLCATAAPSFRRGPPKGYIQALEHRLHQVESVLAAIMTSTDIRSRSIIDELGKDELASHILDTVDAGPFVSISFMCALHTLIVHRDVSASRVRRGARSGRSTPPRTTSSLPSSPRSPRRRATAPAANLERRASTSSRRLSLAVCLLRLSDSPCIY